MIEQSIQLYYEEQPCYEIKLQKDFTLLPQILQSKTLCSPRKACVVTDSNVNQLYGTELLRQLTGTFSFLGSYVFPAGEESKNMETVQGLYEYLIQNSFDRKDVLIAFGGGVVGDLTGFTAATYLRGIDFIQIPTTLLAQVDSSIGGKTGVDFMQYKNMVGAFYMPRLVYMNLSLLNTLPPEQFKSGMAEIVKHGMIKDAAYLSFLEKNSDKIMAKELDTLMEMVYHSCLIKRAVVQKDPKELGERALLNFGHTIGHAIEGLSGFNLTHGSCVALGMVCAAWLSWQMMPWQMMPRQMMPNGKEICSFTSEQFDRMQKIMARFNLPLTLLDVLRQPDVLKHPNDLKHITPSKILEATKLDKKMEAGKIKFILLKELGEAFITKELNESQLLEGINYLWT